MRTHERAVLSGFHTGRQCTSCLAHLTAVSRVRIHASCMFIYLACFDATEDGCDIAVDENGVKGRWIESDLPDALRIYKPRESRSVQIY